MPDQPEPIAAAAHPFTRRALTGILGALSLNPASDTDAKKKKRKKKKKKCPGRTPRCGKTCPDYQTDSANCGSCGAACTGDRSCRGGVCRRPQGIEYEFERQFGADGPSIIRLDSPLDVAINAQGTVYVIDTGNDRVRYYTADGTLIDGWGANGTNDGQFRGAPAIATGADGSVYVVDQGNNRVQRFNASGSLTGLWGGPVGSGNSEFAYPTGISVDSAGSMFVSDSVNRRIQRITSAGVFISRWGTMGSGDGQFEYPLGSTLVGDRLYVVDNVNSRIQIFQLSGAFPFEGAHAGKWGSAGSGEGQFDNPPGRGGRRTGQHLCRRHQ